MKRLKQLLAAVCMTVSMTITSFAGQWMQDDFGWWYQNDDGSYPVSCWQWIDGNGDGIAECYCFDANGYCLMNTITPDGKTVDANGAMAEAGVVQTQAAGWTKTADGSLDIWQDADEQAGGQQTVIAPAETEPEYPVEATVWLSATGEKYHRIPNCGRMNPNKARQVSLNEAVALGYERCTNCY